MVTPHDQAAIKQFFDLYNHTNFRVARCTTADLEDEESAFLEFIVYKPGPSHATWEKMVFPKIKQALETVLGIRKVELHTFGERDETRLA